MKEGLREALVRIADLLLELEGIVVKIHCKNDGTELMRNQEGKYYKCKTCQQVWNWKGEN